MARVGPPEAARGLLQMCIDTLLFSGRTDIGGQPSALNVVQLSNGRVRGIPVPPDTKLSGHRLSPDGQRLACVATHGDDLRRRLLLVDLPTMRHRVFSYPATSAEGREAYKQSLYALQWSPDGRRLAFVQWSSFSRMEKTRRTLVVDTQCGDLVGEVGRAANVADYHRIQWLNEERLLLLGRKLWVVGVDGGGLRRIFPREKESPP